MLVGNKIDICDKDSSLRRVAVEEGEKLAKSHDLIFEEASAVDGTNVTRVFEDLIHSEVRVCVVEIYESEQNNDGLQSEHKSRNIVSLINLPADKGSGGCCG
eukprot:TRINITY_DN5657_c0_g2_i3.p3 TRINITY_DN5657_c0_g2~~TRINITY_DN5657_c0_g2_i3.p3  ORF type:complete len:102 (-),score=20.74 TRINITY_DN5657_c0_g2_i3:110-415(-)